MILGSVAKRYARALLALAQEEGDPVAMADALERVAAVLAVPSVAEVVRNPAVGFEERRALVRTLVDDLGLPKLLENCLFLLAERQRLDIVDGLWRAYVELVDQALGRARVVVRSAVTLTDDQVQEILAAVRKLTGKESLIPVLEVDAELLGGAVCEVEGVVYDGSLRTQVERLAQQMAAGREHG
jgi:F-type H+-transporting ATPase subunit delta